MRDLNGELAENFGSYHPKECTRKLYKEIEIEIEIDVEIETEVEVERERGRGRGREREREFCKMNH